MLLQEHFFRLALAEKNIPVNNLQVKHDKALCYNNGVKYPIVFPLEMINTIKNIQDSVQKTRQYFYRGVDRKTKSWIKKYMNREDSLVTFSNRGRDKNLKYNLDIDYYTEMARSHFVLCPTDVYPWSYRFLEAIMAGCIPILSDTEYDIHSSNFKFYRVSDNHIYRQDWVEYNINKLIDIHTLQ